MEPVIKSCNLCPRACGANRTVGQGPCGGGAHVKLARAALHFWEEPCISGTRGSGTVFFSGCPLRCCFCQNYPISTGNFGKEVPVERLAAIFLELQAQGAHNINLVTATHYAPWVLEALRLARPALQLPVVYNSGGYERPETLRMLEGAVQVYLPDLKYRDGGLSARYSGAPDYFPQASRAILEMYRQVGPLQMGEDGTLQRGLVVRHLVLPKAWRDSVALLEWLADALPLDGFYLSLMSQYTPNGQSSAFPELGRRVSTYEYNRVLSRAQELGFSGFLQERTSAKGEYTPPFQLEGV